MRLVLCIEDIWYQVGSDNMASLGDKRIVTSVEYCKEEKEHQARAHPALSVLMIW